MKSRISIQDGYISLFEPSVLAPYVQIWDDVEDSTLIEFVHFYGPTHEHDLSLTLGELRSIVMAARPSQTEQETV